MYEFTWRSVHSHECHFGSGHSISALCSQSVWRITDIPVDAILVRISSSNGTSPSGLDEKLAIIANYEQNE